MPVVAHSNSLMAPPLREVIMAKIIVFVLALLALGLALAPMVEAKAPATAGIPTDFAAYKAAPGEIWIWEVGAPHPSLIRCNLGQKWGLWYPPLGSVSPSNPASCGAKFDLAKFAIAIGGEPVTCAAGFNPAEMQVNCKKDK